MKQKVVAYICRFHEGLWQLLVFAHDPHLAEAGLQVPAGTLEGTESLQAAVEREIFEESGLQDLMILSKIDEYDHGSVRRHVFLVLAPNEQRDQWTHQVRGHGQDANLNFHFHWVPLARARDLAADLGRSVKPCIQLLFQRPEAH